jgi:hypothetical protein
MAELVPLVATTRCNSTNVRRCRLVDHYVHLNPPARWLSGSHEHTLCPFGCVCKLKSKSSLLAAP